MLPLVIMICGLLFAAIGTVLFSLIVQSRNRVNTQQRIKTESTNELGPQNGLVILSQRLSYLPQRIANGITDANGNVRVISEPDMENYALNTPALFWMDWLNNITDSGSPVANQPDFVLIDSNTVSYTVDTPDNVITIKLIAAFNLGAPLQDPNSSGYYNVTFRYGYEIAAQKKITVAGSTVTTTGRTITIASVLQTDYVDKLIQVHLVRALSRFNLFAINDTMADGTILYDRTSYSGPVYLQNTLYLGGTPTFASTVQISNAATPPFLHQTSGTGFVFKNPSGALNPPSIIAPIAMPTTSTQDSIKSIANKMNLGQNPTASTVPGIYVGTTDVSGVNTISSIYINASDGQDIVIKISNPDSNTNRYHIVHGADDKTIDQNVITLPTFLIFADGRLLIEGPIAEQSKITINSAADTIITNDLEYASGSVGPNTILGLVSWNGNILVAQNIPPPANQSIKNLTIHGVMMAVNGAFGAQGYQDFAANYPGGYVGTIYHTGAFIRQWNLPTLSNDGSKGWGLQTTYDSYLAQSKAPPYFPGNGAYNLIDQNLCTAVEVYVIK